MFGLGAGERRLPRAVVLGHGPTVTGTTDIFRPAPRAVVGRDSREARRSIHPLHPMYPAKFTRWAAGKIPAAIARADAAPSARNHRPSPGHAAGSLAVAGTAGYCGARAASRSAPVRTVTRAGSRSPGYTA
ncbi:hypothetical protein Lfu02_75220 [Longispora fulva]|nr:hypothetical protein Lfu02_75220 [Longispora fulva]